MLPEPWVSVEDVARHLGGVEKLHLPVGRSAVESEALKARVFDILGEVFEHRCLKGLLMEAIRYGDLPDVRALLYQKDDKRLPVWEALHKLIRALHQDGEIGAGRSKTEPIWHFAVTKTAPEPVSQLGLLGGLS